MKIYCFGDSNTYGYDPRSFWGDRYDHIWTEILAEKTGWIVINEGENGRMIPNQNISVPEDIDWLIIMLGTNDLLNCCTPETARRKMERFLAEITFEKKRILLIAPPRMASGEWVQDLCLIKDSVFLATLYQDLAKKLGVHFANADQWNIDMAFDGVHFKQKGHWDFAEKLYIYLSKESNIC